MPCYPTSLNVRPTLRVGPSQALALISIAMVLTAARGANLSDDGLSLSFAVMIGGIGLRILWLRFRSTADDERPEHTTRRSAKTKKLLPLLVVLGLVLAGSSTAARAQSEASIALSLVPVASIVGTASTGSAAVSAVPVALTLSGAVLVVKVVESSARGTVYLLERASDGAQLSVEVASQAASAVALGIGTVVTVSVIGTGVLLSAAGEVLAFLPNALGHALLHNERVTH